MNDNIKDISVIGDGGWGTTLAILLSQKGFKITLWGAFPDYVEVLRSKRVNVKFLPGIHIPAEINITSSRGSDCATSVLVECEAGEGVGIGRIVYLAGEFGGEKRQGGARDDGFVSDGGGDVPFEARVI